MFGNEAGYFTNTSKWNSNTSQLEALSSYHFGLSESIHQDFIFTLLKAVSFHQVLKTVLFVFLFYFIHNSIYHY